MRIGVESCLSYLFNCLILQSISGQTRALASQHNISSIDLGTDSANYSVIQDNNEVIESRFPNRTVKACEPIDCIKNIAFCEHFHCAEISRLRSAHYIVTAVIVFVVIALMAVTIYSCHKESKRLVRWTQRGDRRQDQLMALQIVQTLGYSNGNPPISPIPELIPLQLFPDSPPPYDCGERTPPPDYQEVIKYSN